jgi:opacity protein-like surface antigen
MKILIFAASLLALTSTAMAADIGVSINVGQPGFYGRIDIGDLPQPSMKSTATAITRIKQVTAQLA